MRNILLIVWLSLINILGFRVQSEPVRLQKKESRRYKINRWAYIHQYELLIIITVLMMVIFVLVAFAVVPPMDAWNNHFEEMI